MFYVVVDFFLVFFFFFFFSYFLVQVLASISMYFSSVVLSEYIEISTMPID